MGTHHVTFGLRHRITGDTLILLPRGELDAWADQELFPRMTELLDLHRDPALTGVVVDLGAVTFLDAGGLRLLVRLRNRTCPSGLELRLARTPAKVRRVLRLSRLERTFIFLDEPGSPCDKASGRGVPA
ncbi:STAS domain-containing protein [Streptomyces ortus]|jgi:anti-anti-sigma factor|uniref:STAS domain-containing protein n=1 Tax=Streptomyces ortus TaxID=2867268 RepID=A0ABT3V323_9ACTN|nr:STAS domain-containing protein [Streptomyces ortus]MCX4234395.1 STAS domain-containing protein [Streptomyces ortus]